MSRKRNERDEDAATVPAAGSDDERRPGLRALGLAASRLAGPIVARHGGGVLARLKAEWPAIIGPETAAATWPQSFSRDGVLKLRVAPAAALELQHRTPLLIERINLHLGRSAVMRLIFVQGPLPLAPATDRPAAPQVTGSDAKAIERRVAEILDPELRAALARLGESLASRALPRR